MATATLLTRFFVDTGCRARVEETMPLARHSGVTGSVIFP